MSFIIAKSNICKSKKDIMITLYEGRWASLYLNNEIAEIIISKGYGYKTKKIEVVEAVLKEKLKNKDIDVVLEQWQQDMQDWFFDYLKEGILIDIGPIFKKGPQFFMIPKWVSEKYNIKTVFDLKTHWQIFATKENKTKGVFYNCVAGWECVKINNLKLKAYGLDKFFISVSPGSSKALETAFIMAQKNQTPILGYYWEPTTLMGMYDWYVLKEPKFDKKVWKDIFKAKNNPHLKITKACAYPNLPVNKTISKEMLNKAPDIVEMLTKMKMPLAVEERLLAWHNKTNSSWHQTAIYFLKNNKNLWKQWVSSDALKNIREVLNK